MASYSSFSRVLLLGITLALVAQAAAASVESQSEFIEESDVVVPEHLEHQVPDQTDLAQKDAERHKRTCNYVKGTSKACEDGSLKNCAKLATKCEACDADCKAGDKKWHRKKCSERHKHCNAWIDSLNTCHAKKDSLDNACPHGCLRPCAEDPKKTCCSKQMNKAACDAVNGVNKDLLKGAIFCGVATGVKATQFKSVLCKTDPGRSALPGQVENGKQPHGYCTNRNPDLKKYSSNQNLCGYVSGFHGKEKGFKAWTVRPAKKNICARFSWTVTGPGAWEWKQGGADYDGSAVLKVDGKKIQSGRTGLRRGHNPVGSFSLEFGAGMHSVELFGFEDCCSGADWDGFRGWTITEYISSDHH